MSGFDFQWFEPSLVWFGTLAWPRCFSPTAAPEGQIEDLPQAVGHSGEWALEGQNFVWHLVSEKCLCFVFLAEGYCCWNIWIFAFLANLTLLIFALNRVRVWLYDRIGPVFEGCCAALGRWIWDVSKLNIKTDLNMFVSNLSEGHWFGHCCCADWAWFHLTGAILGEAWRKWRKRLAASASVSGGRSGSWLPWDR